jgi:hypothetical protein
MARMTPRASGRANTRECIPEISVPAAHHRRSGMVEMAGIEPGGTPGFGWLGRLIASSGAVVFNIGPGP